ncbi:MAG TPA: DUF4214 domain-containing protein [Pirellulales bacterium]|nr:DUF4214 domain-containing protein [Pirellulales bacterium]
MPPIEVAPVSPPPPAAPSTPSNQPFINSLYQQLLDRAAEPEALAHWSKLLDEGASRPSIASDIESSPEFRRDEVQSVFRQYLGRDADSAALDLFAERLAAGETVVAIDALLIVNEHPAELTDMRQPFHNILDRQRRLVTPRKDSNTVA